MNAYFDEILAIIMLQKRFFSIVEAVFQINIYRCCLVFFCL